MRLRFLAVLLLLTVSPIAHAGTVLVVQFHNNSQYADLNWVGESVAETLRSEFRAADQIVLDRDSRAAGMHRLSLRVGAVYTTATLIRLGQTLEADYVCYGSYDVHLQPNSSQLKSSSVQLAGRIIDLRKMHVGPEVSEAGKLSELSRLEEHLAWESLKFIDPGSNIPLDKFMSAQKFRPVDAEESYVRGLLSSSTEQQEKWFIQAITLDPQLTNAAFELGLLALKRQDYKQALTWFEHIKPADPRYAETRFKMGLCSYGAGDYTEATNRFREVLKNFPLGEVYNNLAAAENRLNLPIAIDDFRRAVEADQNDPVYLFNLGEALLKNRRFDEAIKPLESVLDRNPDDSEARALLTQAEHHEPSSTAKSVPERLKQNLNEAVFRQLKAMLASKGNP